MLARGAIHSAPGRVRASCSPALRPVRGVLPLDWDRRPRVTPAETKSQEAWPGPEPLGLASLWREPRWNADRRGAPPRNLSRASGRGERDKGASRAGKTARRCRTQRLSAFCFPFFAFDSAAKTEGSRLALRVSGEISKLSYRHSHAHHGARTGKTCVHSRHPEVAVKRPSKDDGPGRESFEARCARTSG